MLGLLKPKAGEVRLGGKPLNDYSIRERARVIAYVPQVHIGTFAFTVETVVLMGRTAHGNCSAGRANMTAQWCRPRSNVSVSRALGREVVAFSALSPVADVHGRRSSRLGGFDPPARA